VFEDGGKEYAALLSAGNSLMFSPHGDNLWLFSLDGTKGPVAAPKGGTGTTHGGEGGKQAGGNVAAGRTVFSQNCAVCHGATGEGGNGGPDLTKIPSAKNRARVIQQVTNGGGGMPAFKGQLTQQQIQDVATFVTQRITNK
jgi:alcohol dehydrogenase (cytochrome c)